MRQRGRAAPAAAARDLAAVRDRIDDLPEPEREGWRKLWADVDALLAK